MAGTPEDTTSVGALIPLTIGSLPSDNEATVESPWDGCYSDGQFRGACTPGVACPTFPAARAVRVNEFCPNAPRPWPPGSAWARGPRQPDPLPASRGAAPLLRA